MDRKLIEEINKLKKEKNAVILVHNYQTPDIYEVADFMGDSLELSKQAANTDADIIIFCGVKFMAETAKILSPEKIVLLPDSEAGCPMANMVSVKGLKKKKQQYPDAAVVSYVNTNADVKAESDICCTSANAIEVVNSLEEDEIIFTPDKNLGDHVQQNSDKKIHSWDGYCYVHERIDEDFVLKAKKNHPDAKIIAHPECKQEVLKHADYITSTSGMLRTAKSDSSKEFIILTESGMIEILKKEFPDKKFYSCGKICSNMKKITLEKVKQSLINTQHKIEIPEDIRIKAEKAINRMIEVK